MSEILDNEKEQIYKEKILRLTIRGSMYRLDKQMQTIQVLMTNYRTKSTFFTLNDIDVIVDCCLREIESKNTSRTRTQILKVMNLILLNEEYLKTYNKRLVDFNQKLENTVLFEDSNFEYSVKEREQLVRLNMRLAKLSKRTF